MGNCSKTLPKVSKCYNENQEYYCKSCDRGLCLRCKGKHIKDRNTQSHIVVCKKCASEEKEYFCKTCECGLCFQCKEAHVKDLETKYHDVIRERVLCTHEDKEYYCNTCKGGLCEQCKERHDQNFDIKYHGIICKLINCTHKDKKYKCDMCQCSLCVLCKEKHVVDMDTKSHDVVIKQEPAERETCERKRIKDLNTQSHIVVCKKCASEEKEYFCKTCECGLCFQCKEAHFKDLETKYHEIIRKRVLCTHEDKEYYCNTCEGGLCEQCKEIHYEGIATKYHEIISKLINCTHKDKIYNCNTCQCSLCVLCKEKHVVDLDTKSHDVVIKQEPVERETCVIHPDVISEMWCLQCKRPICHGCFRSRVHVIVELEDALKTSRHQHKDRILCIRSDILPYNCTLLAKMQSGVKTEIKSQKTKLSSLQAEITNNNQRIKDQIDMAFMIKTERLSKLKSDLIFKLHQRQREMMRHISAIERYENKYEQSANRPAQFLLFLKKTVAPKVKDIPSSFTFSLLGTINNDDALKLLKIQITETERRKIRHEEMLEQMSMPLFYKAVRVPFVFRVRHISLVTSDRFWVSDGEDLILTDTAGHVLRHLGDIAGYGGHAVISDGDLVYIDSNYNIRKLSKQFTTSTLIKKTRPWRPQCIYCSPSTADFLVGMRIFDKNKHRYIAARVTRYDSAGEQIQSIQQNNIGKNLFSEPNYITENRNGDVIVSDWLYGVVVTDREGRHRFSYTGPTPLFRLEPRGICTDVLSNILICDLSTRTVYMIDKNGYFLSLLLTGQQGIREPWSLSYDDEKHFLWVGSRDNQTICVYRHIRRRIITGTEPSYSSN